MTHLDGTITLGKLFSEEYFFRIPEYQRPFLWDDDNLTDLIDDLTSASRDDDYFLGTLVLHHTRGTEYDIVDGQQRLTALCILLACIRDSPGLAADESFRDEVHGKVVQAARALDGVPQRDRLLVRGQEAFNSLVATRGGTTGVDPPGPLGVSERYYLAVDIFKERLDEMEEGELRTFAEFVSQRCVFVLLATTSFEDAFRLFTVVNDRGRQLRRIDVLKSRNLAPDVIAAGATRLRYAQSWEAMEDVLGEEDFEAIFHLLRLIYLRDKPQGDLLKEYETRILGKPGKPALGKGFLDELSVYVSLYQSVFVDSDYVEGRDENARFRSLLVVMPAEFKASEWKACLLAFAHKYGPERLYKFLLELEKVYLEHWVNAVRKDERYSAYTGILAAIADNDDPLETIEAVTYGAEAIQDACRRVNFYGSGFSKYFLLRLELLASEMDSTRVFSARSVEHVLPQNPPEGSPWRSLFSDDEREANVHRVGNLVLLSKSKNSAAGHKPFAVKKERYLKPRVTDFPRSVQVLGYEEWSVDVIETRTEEVANSILQDP